MVRRRGAAGRAEVPEFVEDVEPVRSTHGQGTSGKRQPDDLEEPLEARMRNAIVVRAPLAVPSEDVNVGPTEREAKRPHILETIHDALRIRTRRLRVALGSDGFGLGDHGVHDLDVRVISEDGEMLRRFTLDPGKDYQPLGS
jgi:hypothetical protein